ncbi:MAG: AsmA family protein [Acetobacteraceae bacterium]|nr:AsmA family protein [Acetobacteraceae bacterium]
MSRFPVPRWLAWLGVPLLALAVLAALWSWDWFIPMVEHRASAMLGRPVTIAHLHVRPGRTLTITVEDLRIANPEGFPPDPPFAQVPRATLELDALALLRGQVMLPSVELDRPRLQAIGREDGSRNYALDLGMPAGEAKADLPSGPKIGVLRIRDGRAHVALAGLRSDFELGIETREEAGKEPAVVVEARGTYAAQPITGRMLGGGILNLRDASNPWPVDLRLENGPTSLALAGTLQEPLHLSGADLRLELAGPDMSRLRPLIGVPLPETPPFRLTGQVDYAKGNFRLHEAEGHLGRSDIGGWITLAADRARPEVTAELASRSVDLADLGGFIGTVPGRVSTPGQAPQQRQQQARAEASPRLLPTRPISLPALRSVDAHLRYRADSIQGRHMPFDSMETRLDIVDGVISVRPISLGVGQGRLAGNFVLEPRAGDVFQLRGDIDLRRLDISRLLGAAGVGGAGTLGGVGRIESSGNSIAQLLGRGDGELTLVAVGGNVSALLVDLSGLQFANALLSALGIPQRTPIECLIGDFALQHGRFKSRTLLLDTESSLVTGSGAIDLAREALDLLLRTDAKHFTIGTLPTPIRIAGTLKSPAIQPEVGELVARGGAAAGLGVVFPPLALLPTIQLGVGENSACEALYANAQRRRAPAEGSNRR